MNISITGLDDAEHHILQWLNPSQIINMSEVNNYYLSLTLVKRTEFFEVQYSLELSLLRELDWITTWHLDILADSGRKILRRSSADDQRYIICRLFQTYESTAREYCNIQLMRLLVEIAQSHDINVYDMSDKNFLSMGDSDQNLPFLEYIFEVLSKETAMTATELFLPTDEIGEIEFHDQMRNAPTNLIRYIYHLIPNTVNKDDLKNSLAKNMVYMIDEYNPKEAVIFWELLLIEGPSQRQEDYLKKALHIEYEFQRACKYGDEEMILLLLDLGQKYFGKVDIHANDDKPFLNACNNGRLNIVKLLIKLGEESYGKYNIQKVFPKCKIDNTNVLEYLLNLDPESYGKIDIHFNNDILLRESIVLCNNDMMQFLLECGKESYDLNDCCQQFLFDSAESGDFNDVRILIDFCLQIDIAIDIHADNEHLFRMACVRDIDAVEYVISLEQQYGPINIHVKEEKAFRFACKHVCEGYIDDTMIQYLITLGEKSHGRINIHAKEDQAFRIFCKAQDLNHAGWLYGLGETSYGPIDIRAQNDRIYRYAYKHQHGSVMLWLSDISEAMGNPINIWK